MLTLFIRTLLVYIFMFVVLRLMGKRQLSDMQPFDLAITLLIANLAALPMSDPAIPLLYGVVPIIAMFALPPPDFVHVAEKRKAAQTRLRKSACYDFRRGCARGCHACS